MATTARNGLPTVWVSHIKGLLVGEQSCLFRAWIQAHFRIETRPQTFDFTAWRVDHTALLDMTVETLKAEGWTVTVEGQNFFRLMGRHAILSGKPDLIARKGLRVKVVDVKTGRCRDADSTQVAIYMIALSLAWNRVGIHIDGEVVYKRDGVLEHAVYQDHVVSVPLESVRPLAPRLFSLLRQIGNQDRPAATPSQQECRYCDVSKVDCPDRIDEASPDVNTTEF